MTQLVLDCSVVMSWCFEDESDPTADSILEALRTSEALVPSHWALEVANVLAVSERRDRLTEADIRRFIALLEALPISVDPETARRTFADTLSLARRYQLSSYDAAYLELALRSGCPLCTLDARLGAAARAAGAELFAG